MTTGLKVASGWLEATFGPATCVSFFWAGRSTFLPNSAPFFGATLADLCCVAAVVTLVAPFPLVAVPEVAVVVAAAAAAFLLSTSEYDMRIGLTSATMRCLRTLAFSLALFSSFSWS
uniref:(northern house mosquito) hypothetical protein n=1 Tax=Culex pipiens TaxID=7175 RepID=A0A8D8DIF3_CULPI